MRALLASPLVRRILVAMTIALGIPLTIDTFSIWSGVRETLKRSLDQRIQYTEVLLQQASRVPLWDYAPQSLESTLSAVLQDEAVVRVRVLNDKGETFVERSKEGAFATRKTITSVFNGDRQIGTIELSVTDDATGKEMNRLTAVLFIRGLLQILICLSLAALILHRRLFYRVDALHRQLDQINSGDLETKHAWPDGDELDFVGQKLEITRKTLKRLVKEVSQRA